MDSSAIWSRTVAIAVGALAALSLGGAALAQMPAQPGEISQTQTTASYTVELDIGPAAMMLTSDQAQGATSGEVMLPISGMTMSGMAMGTMAMSTTPMSMTMATTDNGQPVNHHLEAHIYDKTTGAVVSDMMPAISITDEATGQTRSLADVMPMYDIQVGQSDLHFGNNVYLPDGTYTITVTEGQDMAQFADVAVSGGMSLSTSSAMPMGGSSMGSMTPAGSGGSMGSMTSTTPMAPMNGMSSGMP